jgi:glyoxylase-like metal-dependent hydrolase (beta-lactamase superfamily II)
MSKGLVRLTDDVWIWPHDPDPARVQACVGIVAGRGASLIVDAGHSPDLARQVKASMLREGLPEPTLLTYTHHHWDHVWGACAWNVPVVAHKLCAEALRAEAAKPWSSEFLRSEVSRNPRLGPSFQARSRAVRDWTELRVVIPDRVFDAHLDLDIGGIAVELDHVGGPHTADSITVKVPSAKVMFLGDSYYAPPFHLRAPDASPDYEMLTSMVTPDYEWYVESHDEPLRRSDLVNAM